MPLSYCNPLPTSRPPPFILAWLSAFTKSIIKAARRACLPACPRSEWIAEENRHGDVLNQYLYLTGRVNMRVRLGSRGASAAFV